MLEDVQYDILLVYRNMKYSSDSLVLLIAFELSLVLWLISWDIPFNSYNSREAGNSREIKLFSRIIRNSAIQTAVAEVGCRTERYSLSQVNIQLKRKKPSVACKLGNQKNDYIGKLISLWYYNPVVQYAGE